MGVALDYICKEYLIESEEHKGENFLSAHVSEELYRGILQEAGMSRGPIEIWGGQVLSNHQFHGNFDISLWEWNRPDEIIDVDFS